MKKSPCIFLDVKMGEVSELKVKLEQGADPNEVDQHGRVPLHWACQEGFIAIVRLLLKFGGRVNISDNQGFTPLATAAGEGRVAILRELIRAGASANIPIHADGDGTALHLACSWGRSAVVKALVELSDADINARDRSGKTPLAYAMETGDAKLVTYLAEHGAIC